MWKPLQIAVKKYKNSRCSCDFVPNIHIHTKDMPNRWCATWSATWTPTWMGPSTKTSSTKRRSMKRFSVALQGVGLSYDVYIHCLSYFCMYIYIYIYTYIYFFVYTCDHICVCLIIYIYIYIYISHISLIIAISSLDG